MFATVNTAYRPTAPSYDAAWRTKSVDRRTPHAKMGADTAGEHKMLRNETVPDRGCSGVRMSDTFVDSTGDGLFATFAGPARAVRCAQAIGAACAATRHPDPPRL